MTDPQSIRSLARSTALTVSAGIMLVPAYLIPVLSLHGSGNDRTDTIFSGIVGLCENGMWAIGGIVFIASFLVPLLKLASLVWLIQAARRGPRDRSNELTRCYAWLELIGRWSMLDVFLVGFLSGAVQFGALGSIEPRPGIIAFAAVVVLTLLATRAFNPRLLLWTEASDPTVP
jgi:paraquat-inducible protein A